ncbi:BLUF domain-containing protein [Hyphomonas sp.]|uniref:BLUF domain-containing protein n=1 Tax=Hyphomonas sp. TaxID=87 RepID=UPI00391AB459
MDILRVIYTSRPFGYDVSTLSGILMHARRANERDGITGALICRADIYIQWLEGPEAKVRAALARIMGDDRHLEVTLQAEDRVAERTFADWAMLHDPAVTWIWTQNEIDAGALDRTTPEELIGFFLKLRGLTGAASEPG